MNYHAYPQVAFGTDLQASIDFEALGLNHIKQKANGRLGFLNEHALESLTANYENPLLKVININVLWFANISMTIDLNHCIVFLCAL